MEDVEQVTGNSFPILRRPAATSELSSCRHRMPSIGAILPHKCNQFMTVLFNDEADKLLRIYERLASKGKIIA